MTMKMIQKRTVIMAKMPPQATPLAYTPYCEALMYSHLAKYTLDCSDSRMATIPKMGLMNKEQNAMGQLSSGRLHWFGVFVITGRMYEVPDTVYVEYRLLLLPYIRDLEPTE